MKLSTSSLMGDRVILSIDEIGVLENYIKMICSDLQMRSGINIIPY